MFIDHARIYVSAGRGGDGCNSFYQDRLMRYGRPDGGDGGKGGDVVIASDENVSTLLDFQYRQHFRAQAGGHGSSKNKTGRQGHACVIKVPPGTIIHDQHKHLLKDLKQPGEEVVVARGGSGGFGNQRRVASRPGKPGEEKTLTLELKLIADVGIVGYPNAGKSSLINCVCATRSKVACYPFTTKEPVLGVINAYAHKKVVLADIPGLIEGAHKGRGLGDRFLRHIERTRILIHLVDMSDVDAGTPEERYRKLNLELSSYSPDLAAKTQIIVANKMDMPQAQENLARFRSRVKKPVLAISCITRSGLDDLIKAMLKKI